MNRNEEYLVLIDDALFEEVFLLLEQNINKIEDPISRSKHFKDFFTHVFSQDSFNKIIVNGRDNYHLSSFSKAAYHALSSKEFLKPMENKILDFVRVDKLMMLFSNAVINNDLDVAAYFLKYISKDLTLYPQTFADVVDKNNIESLRFLCNNMENIHFNKDALLRVCSGCSTKILQMLIEDFDFNINELSDNGSLVHILVQEKNEKNFKFVVDNYSNIINWGKSIKQGTIFDLIDKNKLQVEFFEPLLDDMSLKDTYIARIMNSLFSKYEVITQCYESDVYSKLFSHPNFDPYNMNLGQGYILYGLLSELGRSVNSEYINTLNTGNSDKTKAIAYSKAEEVGRPYLKILKDFLTSYPSDEVPDSTNYNIIGAAVCVANDSKSEFKILHNAANMIMHRYPVYLNKPNPNPNQTLPIMQVEKDSEVYRLLISNGAIAPEAETGFFRSIAGFLGRKNKPYIPTVEDTIVESRMPNSKLITLRNQMREDFKIMRGDLSNPLCDSVIKFKCENMFLRSEKLVMMMDKHSFNNSVEEIHFLGNNFSNYLKESLRTYIEVCQAVVDLGSDDKLEKRLGEAKEKCLEQIDLLAEQLSLISENVYNEVEGNATRNQNIRGRFLQKRFSRGTDLGIDKVISTNNEKIGELNEDKDESEKTDMHNLLSENNRSPLKFKR